MVKLKALERFPYAERTRNVGDEFDASESDAHLLTLIGRAARVEDAAPAQTYETRDIVARAPHVPRRRGNKVIQ